ncbi:helix-turn-helix domain-containing protein [Streptomyces sp. BI20]|uniref:helix-turn-helix domain-containing protein n=1 Tax=Streptomyces sp. BI20 TaxID=3403460 RepID=UPI003C72063F
MPGLQSVDPTTDTASYLGAMVQRQRTATARKRAGLFLTQEELGHQVGVSQSRISDIETGKVPPDLKLARALERVLSMIPDSLAALVQQMKDTRIRDYSVPYFQRLREAETINHFGGLVVPGTLQTVTYTAALLRSGMIGSTEDEIRAAAEDRWERAQEILTRPVPPYVSTILYEGVLRAAQGDLGAVRDQLEYLLKLAVLPHISIRILPFSAPAIAGGLTMLTFAHGEGRAAYVEGYDCGSHTEESAPVAQQQRVYDRLSEEAERPGRSVEMIRDALESLR